MTHFLSLVADTEPRNDIPAEGVARMKKGKRRGCLDSQVCGAAGAGRVSLDVVDESPGGNELREGQLGSPLIHL